MSTGLPLSRGALADVLQSLLLEEWKGGVAGGVNRALRGLRTVWPEDLALRTGDGPGACLGLDSLEVLRGSAAANEMFHVYETGREGELLRAGTWGEWLDVLEENWRAGVTRITFSSSGSTGVPHRCTHELSFLATEVDYLAQLLADRKRIVSQVPAHHIYGFLFTAMLADRLGVEVAREMGATLREGDLLVAVPEQWEWMRRSIARWPGGVEGVTSTAPCPRGLIAGLMECGLGGMTEVYGSSETAGVGTRRWPDELYRWMPQWSPMDELEGGMRHVSGRTVELMDRIERHGADCFVVEGRRDRAVQVGGNNVYPEHVAKVLRGVPWVRDVAVRMMRAEEGGRLKAFVVASGGLGLEEMEDELERWAREHLTVAERPKSWTFGGALPVNEMGKAADW